ncbi:glycerophosphodiester phosphodiesterase family protein [Xanthobacteraceae bacterium A53D]
MDLTLRPVAHRGLHDASAGVIENSASAVEAAVAAGFAIEVDVQRSRDGEAMVHHDFTLDRLTFARGRVADHTAAELQAVRFQATADAMMTLPELLARVAGRALLLIEIKSDFSGDLRLATRAAELVAAYDGPAALMSFDPDMVATVAQTAPQVMRGIVAMERFDEHPEHISAAKRAVLGNLLHWPRSQFQFVAYRVADLEAPAPRLMRARGVPLLTWTVRTPEDRAMAAAGADQIIFEGFRP